jgi:hypothetical protein
MSFEAAFLPWLEKQAIVASAREEIAGSGVASSEP